MGTNIFGLKVFGGMVTY